ncbi:RluA family pseudouridine synthase [Vibrio crassostreae]|uniref:RluA family pseudouridine synthase n=1 Tax=Vibrio crassostreae TaxID=246167 RepID=UPI000F46F214|nr:RluA family pseudouridine synthase [Vibrio crassostreae]ROP15885.1 RluA family pseudouridine synthase [Vibrio crassostreae]ROP20848.1 RluA family pseudouridine synthase [Vibrio crassostreae]RPE94070.1 tRNA pseudouridine32 synthase/23S rRNA pseudouridine746 synthase [Vibrio crassostreae]TCN65861.1 RluA family pseudouridine synthase [Vibrio crassostreae]TCV09424.1 tRNA pseudouridine32 synthase/23S rRNA pseudouridine746 synthase [Vibrio crassostreae]
MSANLAQYTPLRTLNQTANQDLSLPERFTFPYYYTPHPLCELAMQQLQQSLLDCGLNETSQGNLYAVLLVQDPTTQELGYLSAFSGLQLDPALVSQLNNIHFVPPAFDSEQFQSQNSANLARQLQLADDIEKLQQSHNLDALLAELEGLKIESAQAIEAFQLAMAENKAQRNELREQANQEKASGNLESAANLLKQLGNQSSQEKRDLKALRIEWKQKIAERQSQVDLIESELKSRKQDHQTISDQLETQRLSHYRFINQTKQSKNLLELLDGKDALEGSGDCCLPKLLNFAFEHGFKPLALSEFWWGLPPTDIIRQHANLYPVCQSKSFEILDHQLSSIELEDNPLIVNPAVGKSFDIVYEDDEIVVVNKPEEFLSVPGKFIEDSVYTRIKARYPDATGPLIIHRLDMSTSGLLILALTAESNKHIQKQFIDRTVQKRYTALLDGEITGESGDISLPLRGDITDRPRQLVCNQHGRNADTHWQAVSTHNGKTKVHLYPKTGRTHQLRVHCAHPLGLGVPIRGDDLYGYKRERLHLHAGYLKLIHPTTGEWMEFEVPSEF